MLLGWFSNDMRGKEACIIFPNLPPSESLLREVGVYGQERFHGMVQAMKSPQVVFRQTLPASTRVLILQPEPVGEARL